MIEVFADPEALSAAAAELFVRQANNAVAARGRFVASLSGGSTPKRVFELLAQPPLRDRVPWPRVHLFWGDERCVSADDPRSNYRMTKLALLDHVPIPPAQVHPIDGSLPPAESARQYESLLKSFFGAAPPRFDLVFLGLGENGHTASLFPHTPVLAEKSRWVREVNILDIDQLTRSTSDMPALLKELERDFEIAFTPDQRRNIKTAADALAAAEQELRKKQQVIERVTMTAPLLNQATLIAFLAAGAGKAKVLRKVIEGPCPEMLLDTQRLPAQLIHPDSDELRWMLDRAAAAGLSER